MIYNNNNNWRAFGAVGIPAVKEPSGLDRQDGKRSDGLTLIPWHAGRSLVWDVSRQPISCFLRSHSSHRRWYSGRYGSHQENTEILDPILSIQVRAYSSRKSWRLQFHNSELYFRKWPPNFQFSFVCIFFSTWQKLMNFFTYIRPKEIRSVSYNSVYLILACGMLRMVQRQWH